MKNFSLPKILAFTLGITPVIAVPASAQEAASPAATQWPALPDIGDTTRMDPDVVALLETHRTQVLDAQATAQGTEGQTAVGTALTELGLAFEANTMWTPARDAYLAAYETLPGEGSHRDQWLYRVGVCEHALGHVERAAEVLGQVAPKLSGTAVVQARLAGALFDLGDLEGARDSWLNAIASEQIAWEKADPALRSKAPIPIAASRVGLAQVEWELDLLKESEKHLQEALKIQPRYPHAHYLLGQIYAEQGREADARFQLARGLNAYPVMPPDPHGQKLASKRAGYGNRMRNIEIAMQEGRVPQAVADLDAIIAERPDDVMALNLAARAQTMMNRLDKALEVLQRSETVDPTHYQTKNQLAITYINLVNTSQDPVQRGQYMEQAKVKSDEAIALAPHLGQPYFYRGLVELSKYNPQDPSGQQVMQTTLAYFKQAHTLGCLEPQLFDQITQIYAQMGRTREMVKFAEQGAKRSPENPASWILLARAYLTVGEGTAALRAGDRAAQVAPNDPNVKNFVQQLRALADQQKQQQTPAPKAGQ